MRIYIHRGSKQIGGSYDMVKEWLVRHSIQKYNVHTSGYASLADPKKFVSAINPSKVTPIHSFFPEKYPELFPKVEAHNDDEWWEI